MALVPYMGPKLLLDLPPQPNQIQVSFHAGIELYEVR